MSSCLQTLAHGLQSSRSNQQASTAGRASTAEPTARHQDAGSSHHSDRLTPRQQHDQPSLRSATQRAEEGLQQRGEQVQGQMHSMQDTLQEVCQSLQSLQAAFQQPAGAGASVPSRHKVHTLLNCVQLDTGKLCFRVQGPNSQQL